MDTDNNSISMKPCVSAIICTHNRADLLKKAIDSLVCQSLSPEQFEILVVDNASTDDTRAVVHDYCQLHANINYIHEPRLGLSVARNTGLREAKSSYIAYLDDDAVADRQWLALIAETFEKVIPEPGAVGGKIEPIWEIPPPPWLHESYYTCLTILDLGIEPSFIEEPWSLYGTNMAFPRKLLLELGGFQSDLGRSGKNLLGNEEMVVQKKIREKGAGIYYHGGIKVRHFTPKERLRAAWIMRRFYWQGISDILMEPASSHSLKQEIAALFWNVKYILWHSVHLRRKMAEDHMVMTAVSVGRISGIMRLTAR